MDPYGRPPPPPFQSPRPPPPGQHFVQPPAGAPHPPPMSADYHAASPAAQGHDQFALSTAYDSVKRVMLNPYNNNRMEEKDLDDFKIILQMIMQDCSRTNIESGKTWVFKYCYEPQQIEVIADLWLALSQSRNSFLERLHLIYLVNDILFHSVRRQQMWMKEAILPRLVPLLRQAYHYSGISTDMKSKVTKVISIWSDKHFFDPNVLDSIRKNVVIPPPPPAPLTPYDVKPTPPPPGAVGPPLPPHPNMHPSMAPPMPPMPSPHFNPGFRPPFPPPPAGYPYPLRPHIRPPPMPPAGVMPPHPPPGMNPHLPPRPMMSMPRPPPPPPVIPAAPPHAYPPTTESQNPTQIEQTAPEKQYYELPAGLMLSAVQINDDTYSAIRPSEIQQVYSYPSPTDEMNRAVDDFYWGLDLRDRDNAEEFEEQADSKLDRSGWEPGYLDTHYEMLKQKQNERREREEREGRRGRQRRRSDSHEEERGRYGRSSRSSRRDHSRSRSRSRSDYSSRSRSRSYSPERGRSPRRRHSRGSRGHHRHHYHSRSRSPYSRSRSRDSYKSPRSRSMSPYRRRSKSRSDSRYRYRSRSRSRSPPPTLGLGGGGSGSMNRYLAHVSRSDRTGPSPGIMPSDDSSKYVGQGHPRGYHQANELTCYNCSKSGHFARDCPEASSTPYNRQRC